MGLLREGPCKAVARRGRASPHTSICTSYAELLQCVDQQALCGTPPTISGRRSSTRDSAACTAATSWDVVGSRCSAVSGRSAEPRGKGCLRQDTAGCTAAMLIPPLRALPPVLQGSAACRASGARPKRSVGQLHESAARHGSPFIRQPTALHTQAPSRARQPCGTHRAAGAGNAAPRASAPAGRGRCARRARYAPGGGCTAPGWRVCPPAGRHEAPQRECGQPAGSQPHGMAAACGRPAWRIAGGGASRWAHEKTLGLLCMCAYLQYQ